MKHCKSCTEYTCGGQGSKGISKTCGRDCKNCKNCDSIHGFMTNCHYSYNDEEGHHQVGQYVHRSRANSCEHYTEQEYDRDKFFVI